MAVSVACRQKTHFRTCHATATDHPRTGSASTSLSLPCQRSAMATSSASVQSDDSSWSFSSLELWSVSPLLYLLTYLLSWLLVSQAVGLKQIVDVVKCFLNFLKDKKSHIFAQRLTLKALRNGSHIPSNNTMPAFYLRKCSRDGATTDCSGRHLAVYYSFIDPERTKG